MAEQARRVITLDVRETIRRGEEPCALVLAAVAALGPDDDLLLISPFEPRPVYGLVAAQGLTPHVECDAEGTWRVHFRRDRTTEPAH